VTPKKINPPRVRNTGRRGARGAVPDAATAFLPSEYAMRYGSDSNRPTGESAFPIGIPSSTVVGAGEFTVRDGAGLFPGLAGWLFGWAPGLNAARSDALAWAIAEDADDFVDPGRRRQILEGVAAILHVWETFPPPEGGHAVRLPGGDILGKTVHFTKTEVTDIAAETKLKGLIIAVAGALTVLVGPLVVGTGGAGAGAVAGTTVGPAGTAGGAVVGGGVSATFTVAMGFVVMIAGALAILGGQRFKKTDICPGVWVTNDGWFGLPRFHSSDPDDDD
jgi:hypothetical protein